MNLITQLPQYDNNTLSTLTPAELIELMVRDEDRVPRNVIDECAGRGEQMLDTLTPIAIPDDERENKTPGYWWLRLHAIMILGLMPGEAAGLLLVDFIRNMSRDEDEDDSLHEWFSGYWPALTENKPTSTIALLRDISIDKKINSFMRADIAQAVIANAQKQGEDALEKELDWAAKIAGNEEEDWDYRCCIANTLLDLPRERHHKLLTSLADEQGGPGTYFTKKEVHNIYTKNTDKPEWENFSNPWQFYDPKEIEYRQQRWQKQDIHKEEDFFEEGDTELEDLFEHHHSLEPYQRETPKIGRNDPCYCGSGKKYKKCCLNNN